MPKQLLITADDFGVHDVIDKGIYKCIEAGVIDCVDIIVTYEGTDSNWTSQQRISKLLTDYGDKIESGDLKLGLHLSLTCGSPAYQGSTGYRDTISVKENFNGNDTWVFKYGSPAVFMFNIANMAETYLDDFKLEIEEQYNAFVRYTNRKPAHISSHAGVFHTTQKLYEAVSSFANDKGIAYRCPTFSAVDYAGIWSSDPAPKMVSKIAEIGGYAALGICNVNDVINWNLTLQRGAFVTDLQSNGLISTYLFIEHFYQQKDRVNPQIGILSKIINKIKSSDENYSYEMVVHPVWYEDSDEFLTKVRGVKMTKGVFKKRKIETEALTAKLPTGDYVVDALKGTEIETFELPENSTITP